MSQLIHELPRDTIVLYVGMAGLAAVGLTSLLPPSGGRDQLMIVVPVLTALLALALLVRTRDTVDRARDEIGSVTGADPATGVGTIAAGEHTLQREFAAAQRGRTLTVALIRVDGLSRYRAEHGEAVADQLLRIAGRVLNLHCRGMHLTAHHREPGTFLSILSGVDRKGAGVYATRVRRDLLAISGLPRPAGVTVGVATYDFSMASPDDLVRRAQFALRKGSAAGGKVIVVGGGDRDIPTASRLF